LIIIEILFIIFEVGGFMDGLSSINRLQNIILDLEDPSIAKTKVAVERVNREATKRINNLQLTSEQKVTSKLEKQLTTQDRQITANESKASEKTRRSLELAIEALSRIQRGTPVFQLIGSKLQRISDYSALIDSLTPKGQEQEDEFQNIYFILPDPSGQKKAFVFTDNSEKFERDLKEALSDPNLSNDERIELMALQNCEVLSLSDFRYLIRQYMSWYNQQISKKIDPKIDETNTKDENIPILSELKTVREEMKEFFRLLHKHPETEQFKTIIDDLKDYKQFLSQIIELLSSERELSWSDIVITQVRQLSKEKKIKIES
jgi:hypothetical protein